MAIDVIASAGLNVAGLLSPADATEHAKMIRYSNPKVLLATSLGAFLPPFTSSVISFSVPEIGHDLGASFVLVVWVPLAYLIALPSLMILIGKLSDILGRSKFYFLGLSVFAAGGLLAAVSGSIAFLIFSSLVMGIGGSLLSVNSTAIVSSVYPPESRGGALGINAMSVYLGLTSGPLLAGVLIEFLGWRSLFYLVASFAVLSLIPVYAFLRAVDFQSERRRIDFPGFAAFLLAILSIVLYLGLGQMYGWLSTIYLLIFGLAMLAAFILYERGREEPILNLSLFTKNRTFSAANFTAFLNYISTFAIVFVFSIYFSVIAHMSPSQAGLVLTVEPALMVIFSPISGRMADRFGSRILASFGMLVISISFLFMYTSIGRVAPTAMVWPLGVIGVGFGFFSAPNTNSVMGSVEKRDSGTASGTLGTMRFVGQLMSLALMSSVLAGSMPRSMLFDIFSGVGTNLSAVDIAGFMNGLRFVMLLSCILSFAGVFTSLVRNS